MLLDAFLSRLETRIEALRGGRFDVADWTDRQVTTGRAVTLDLPDGSREERRALGVDPVGGALILEDAARPAGEQAVHAAEVRHVRLAARDTVEV